MTAGPEHLADSDAQTPDERRGLRYLMRDTAFYGAAVILNKAFFLITLPLLTRYFGSERYGSVDLFFTTLLFLTAATVLGQDSALARFFYLDSDMDRRRQVVTQSLLTQTLAAAVVMSVLWTAAGQVSIAKDLAIQSAIPLLALHLPFMAVFNFSQGLLKWTFARNGFALMTLGQTIAFVAGLGLVVLVRGDMTHVFLASLASRAVFALYGLWLCRRWLAVPRGSGYFWPLVRFGVPFGVIASIGTLVPVLERSITASLLGLGQLGLYAAGATVALIVNLPVQAFQMAWAPFYLAIHQDAIAPRIYDQVFRGFALLACISVVGLAAVGPTILALLAGSDFAGGAKVVVPLAMAFALQGISWVSEIGITLSLRSYLQLPAYLAFLASAALTIWLLAPSLGLVGVASGVLVGHATKGVVASWLAQRAHPLPWSYRGVLILAGVTLACAIVVGLISTELGLIPGLIAGSVGCASIACGAWLTIFSADERDRFGAVVMTRLRAGGLI